MASHADSRRQPFSSSRVHTALLVCLVSAVVLGPLIQLRFVAQMDPDTYSDLYSPWRGARAVLHGSDPYSPSITAEIQQAIYGHTLQPADLHDPEAFVYPAYIALLLAPFTQLAWPVVERLFAILTPFVILATGWAWLRLFRTGIGGSTFDRITSFSVPILMVASWPGVWGCYQRQPSIFVMAALAFSILWFSRSSDIVAGIFLALSTVKPQLMILPCAWMLLAAIRLQRWRFVCALFLALALLVLGAVVFVPGWIPHWFHAVIAYTHTAGKIALPAFVLGSKPGILVDGALLAGLSIQLWKLRCAPPASPAFFHSAALILAATTCLIPANPWLVFNNLLLTPAILILAVSRPAGFFPKLLRVLAGAAVLFALLITPLCAALGLCFGFSTNLVMPPFLIYYLLPLPVMAALLAVRFPRESHQQALAGAGTERASR